MQKQSLKTYKKRCPRLSKRSQKALLNRVNTPIVGLFIASNLFTSGVRCILLDGQGEITKPERMTGIPTSAPISTTPNHWLQIPRNPITLIQEQVTREFNLIYGIIWLAFFLYIIEKTLTLYNLVINTFTNTFGLFKKKSDLSQVLLVLVFFNLYCYWFC
uniref:Uncharacterized protein n=1 Tax=Cacopsylla melanoneura TaxID=428564 RepID=A0A8D8TS57_9HEMI